MSKVVGIKKRWFFNYVLVLLLAIIFIEGLFLISIQKFYYNNVFNILSDRGKVTIDFYKKYYDTDIYTIDEIAELLVNNYSDNELAEMQVLDIHGKIIASSNKFLTSKKVKLPKELTTNIIELHYKLPETQEKVMAVYIPLLNKNNQVIGILRYVTSLKKVDQLIYRIFLYSILVLFIIVLILSVLSLLFTKTIINPIEKIILVTQKLANGKYNTRIDEEFKDELEVLANSINKMASQIQSSEKAKNEFMSMITHEIRTPLTAIKGWSETIVKSDYENTDEIETGLNVIIKESERLSSMVEELLQFSKLEAGNLKIFKENNNLIDLVYDVLSIYKGKFESKDIKSKFRVDSSNVNVLIDSNRIRQVLINILENAYKFSEYHSVIQIILKENKKYIILEIRDDGIGISKDDLKKVKNKFFKSSSKKSGSGLGLAISNEIMKLHDGILEIDSVFGEGTVVRLKFKK